MTDEAGEMDLGLEVSKGLAAKVVQAFLGFTGSIVLARVVGPAGFGGFFLIMGIAKIVDWPVDGWADGTKKRFSETDAPRSEVVGSQLLVYVVVLAGAVIVTILAGDWLRSYTGVQNAPIYFIAIFASMTLFYPFQRMLSAKGKVGLSTWNDTFRSLLTFLGQVSLVVLGWGVTGMVVGWVGATILTIPLSLVYLRTRPALPKRETIRSIAWFARYSALNSIFGKAYSRYDVLLLGFLLGPVAAAQYEVAFKLSVPAAFISTVAGSGLMVKVSNLHSRGEDFSNDITNTLSFSGLFAIPMLFGAAAMPRAMVRTVYGTEYVAAAALLVGLLVFQVIETQSSVLRQAINGINRPDTNMKVAGATLLFNIVTGYVLTLIYGAIGVVIATVAAETGRYVVNLLIVNRELSSLNPFPRLLKLEFAAATVMFIVVYGLRQLIQITSWIPLLFIVGIGGFVYFLFLTVVSPQFRHTGRSIATSSKLGPLLGMREQG